MSSPQLGHGSLVLDGGVLTEWFAARYTVSSTKPWPVRGFKKQFLRTEGDLEKWERVLARYRGRLHVSAYSMAEVQRHARDGEKNCDALQRAEFCPEFWRGVGEALAEYPINERHVIWTELDQTLLHKYGPADASLVTLTQRLVGEHEQPCIVTVDGRLRTRCADSDLDVPARDPYEYVAVLPE